jgi:hypothetical protein
MQPSKYALKIFLLTIIAASAAPIMVDLPLAEPRLDSKPAKRAKA